MAIMHANLHACMSAVPNAHMYAGVRVCLRAGRIICLAVHMARCVSAYAYTAAFGCARVAVSARVFAHAGVYARV